MSVYFKLKIDENEDGKIKAITVRNQKINYGLFTFLHQVVHTAIRMYNGDWEWMDYRITFEHNGKRYVQDKGDPCVGCCFLGSNDLGVPDCKHPFKNSSGGKGVCNGLVYKEEMK